MGRGGHSKALEEPESARTPVLGGHPPLRTHPSPVQMGSGGGVGVWGSGDELVTRRPRGPCPWNSTKEKHYGKMILFSNNDNVAGMASEDVYIF